MTEPAPAVCANVILSVLSGPLVTVLPAASSIVAVNVRVVADARLAVEPDSTIWVAVPNVTVKVWVLELVAVPLTVPLAPSVTGPARLPVIVSVAIPATAWAALRPVTEPAPVVCANVMLSVASGPVVTVLPAASSIVAVNVRVVRRREIRGRAREHDLGCGAGDDGERLGVGVGRAAVDGPVGWRVTVPASVPVIVSCATPSTAATVLRPVTVPVPAVCAKVIMSVASAPVVIVLPAASSIVAVNVRVVADARFAVEPESTIWVAVPNVIVKVWVLELVRPGPLTVALAWSVTVPASVPVIVSCATPPTAATVLRPVTVPAPVVCAKVIMSVASGPVVTVLPAASSIVAVNVRVVADARFAVEPDSTIFEAAPDIRVTFVTGLLVAVHDRQTAVTVYW